MFLSQLLSDHSLSTRIWLQRSMLAFVGVYRSNARITAMLCAFKASTGQLLYLRKGMMAAANEKNKNKKQTNAEFPIFKISIAIFLNRLPPM